MELFLSGVDNYEGSNLYSEDCKLVNYTTVIAYREGDDIYLNGNYYSPTTSKHQNQIRNSGDEYYEVTYPELEDIMNGKPIE